MSEQPPNSQPTSPAKRPYMQILIISGGLAILFVLLMFIRSLSAKAPDGLGVKNGRLSPAPSSPNCVMTQTDSKEHRMEPVVIPKGVSNEALMADIRAVIEESSNASVISATDDYLHAEFVSRFFRFVDDVEFFVDSSGQQIHFRSASRVGYSDLGVNRERMRTLIANLEQKLAARQ